MSIQHILYERRIAKRRFGAAISAVELLTHEQHKELLEFLVERIEAAEHAPPAAPKPIDVSAVSAPVATPRPARSGRPRRRTSRRAAPGARKTDLAEAAVRERPGLTSAEISELVGQGRAAGDSTLRQVMRLRRSIVRKDGRWYPAPPNGGPAPGAN